ncbi:MAG: hypothetical protein AVDCRST_MAG49-266, partial [uncultured Thermomicrobiales bacterium]
GRPRRLLEEAEGPIPRGERGRGPRRGGARGV